MNMHVNKPSRRAMLQGMAGLVIAFHLPREARAQSGAASVPADGKAAASRPTPSSASAPTTPSPCCRSISNSDRGLYRSRDHRRRGARRRLVADARANHAPANAKLYNNTAFGPIQGTGGSTAIANSYDQMRKAGATARAMLVAAASEAWNVPAAEITVERGALRHAASASGKGASAQFAEAAAKLPVPDKVALKDPSAFRLIGRDGVVQQARHAGQDQRHRAVHHRHSRARTC